MSSLKPLARALAGALAACPGIAAAEAAPPVLDSVIVTARANPEEPPVVGAARTRLSETPGAVSVISAESYERRLALALDDVLRDAPGVYAQKKWGGDIRISIRGSGLGNANHNRGLLLAQDGVPLNEADGYGDSQAVDPLIARYVEVHRGGNALRFGGSLLGGAINVVTPTGADAGFANRVRIDAGAFGLVRQHVAVARQVGDWDLYLAGTNQTGQGWRPQSQQNLQFATLNLGRGFANGGEARLTISGANIDQEIPGALTRAQFDADPRQPAPASYANDQARDVRNLRALLRVRWPLAEGLSVEAAGYAVWKDLDHPIFQVIDQQSRNYGGFLRLDWDGELGGRRADAYAGVWAREGDLDSNFYLNVKGARGRRMSTSLQNARALDAFAEGRVFVTPALALVAGGTWGRAERDYRSFAIAGTPAFDLAASRTYSWFAPRIGLLWQAPGGEQVFANLTRSVEPPNFSALSPSNQGLADIDAQSAWTWEIGTRGRRGALAWDVSAYRAELRNELLLYATTANGPAITFNADDTVHQGLEAALDWTVGPLRLRQTYTWSDFRGEGKRLPVVPEHFYRAELRYQHPGGAFVAPSLEWSPSGVWSDFANTDKADGYVLVNLNAGFELRGGVAVFVEARNLADRRYISNVQPQITTGAGSAAYWPGDGRSIFGGVKWDF
ncbi:TonB-dependent receptor family protein [Phenylobacterium sp.]|jgi:iron complex outermembrane receptor protein|uniref:TonB-dependent receptor family protein n=1 Tax=Phenylobacterium sp. TaxID=1871053 RepID=UPI003783EE90